MRFYINDPGNKNSFRFQGPTDQVVKVFSILLLKASLRSDAPQPQPSYCLIAVTLGIWIYCTVLLSSLWPGIFGVDCDCRQSDSDRRNRARDYPSENCEDSAEAPTKPDMAVNGSENGCENGSI